MISLFASLLPPGSEAPDFTLADDAGRRARLWDFRGKQAVVLVFYPMDETPGCRRQLCEIRDQWAMFQTRGVALFGVNPGSPASHARFRQNHRFPFPLLVDQGKKLARLYGSGGLLVRRTVYAIDKSGRIAFAARGKPEPSRILAALPSDGP